MGVGFASWIILLIVVGHFHFFEKTVPEANWFILVIGFLLRRVSKLSRRTIFIQQGYIKRVYNLLFSEIGFTYQQPVF